MIRALKAIIKRSIESSPSIERRVRLLARRRYAETAGYPDWNVIIGADRDLWAEKLKNAATGRNILIATSVGSHLPATTVESALAAALTLRGANVHVLLCDDALPACLACDSTWYPKPEVFVRYGPARDLCRSCFKPANRMYSALGVKIHRYSEYLDPNDYDAAERISSAVDPKDVATFRLDGLAVGEHALAGALRFFARATLEGEPHGEKVLRRYFKASLLTAYAVRRLFKTVKFECAAFHHGIYVPQGIIGEVARQEQVRVVNWNPAYRKRCFIFSHDNTYHHTLMDEPVSKWDSIRWNSEIEKNLLGYLKSRWTGSEDWIWFHELPRFDLSTIASETGVDFSKPCIGMLTNVMWDAQLHYPANAFANMLEWVLETIRYFKTRPDLQLLIRVHPAEIRGTLPSRQPIVEEIKNEFKELPKNVFVIGPDSHVSTYAAMSECNAVIIYGTKTGVELTSMAIPVIVAGEAWIRNKGVTLDAKSKSHYFELLGTLPLNRRMDASLVGRARKYAYHFFFRRMIPIECMEPAKKKAPYVLSLDKIDGLAPGASKGLDVVCEGILSGTDFIYPAELDPLASLSSRGPVSR